MHKKRGSVPHTSGSNQPHLRCRAQGVCARQASSARWHRTRGMNRSAHAPRRRRASPETLTGSPRTQPTSGRVPARTTGSVAPRPSQSTVHRRDLRQIRLLRGTRATSRVRRGQAPQTQLHELKNKKGNGQDGLSKEERDLGPADPCPRCIRQRSNKAYHVGKVGCMPCLVHQGGDGGVARADGGRRREAGEVGLGRDPARGTLPGALRPVAEPVAVLALAVDQVEVHGGAAVPAVRPWDSRA